MDQIVSSEPGRDQPAADLADDETPAVQVVMLPELFEQFREWLARDVNADEFEIPATEDDLPTYCVAFRRP